MEIIFYYNSSDDRFLNKTLVEGVTLEGSMRDAESITAPRILFTSDSFMRFNYCYIPEYRRYYFVRDVQTVRTGLFLVSLEIDVLMSFRGDIAGWSVILDKTGRYAEGNEYIDDGSFTTDATTVQQVYNFAAGFNNNPEYILITAG